RGALDEPAAVAPEGLHRGGQRGAAARVAGPEERELQPSVDERRIGGPAVRAPAARRGALDGGLHAALADLRGADDHLEGLAMEEGDAVVDGALEGAEAARPLERGARRRARARREAARRVTHPPLGVDQLEAQRGALAVRDQ